MDYLKSLRVAGLREFWLEAIIIIPLSCLLALDLNAFVKHLPFVIEGVAVFICMDFWSCLWNCIADYELDKISLNKRHLALATEKLGLDNAKKLAIAFGFLGLLLGLHMSVTLGRPILLGLLLFGAFLGYAYSVEPFRVKGRGALRFIVLSLLFRVLPLLFGYFMLTTKPTLSSITFLTLFIVAGVFVSGSLNIVYNLADLWEEEKLKVTTMELIYGVDKSLEISKIMIILGTILCLIAYLFAGVARHMPLVLAGVATIMFSLSYFPVTYLVIKRNTEIQRQEVQDKMPTLSKYMKIYPTSLKLLRSMDLVILLILSL